MWSHRPTGQTSSQGPGKGLGSGEGLGHPPSWQQSDSVQAPLMRAPLDQHSCHSPRNVAPAAHIDWSAKADRPHVGLQHSDCSAHLSPQS